jgi:hypothetical protein
LKCNDPEATLDQTNRNFDNYIRDVEDRFNPYRGKVVQVPAGYNYAWINPLGQVVQSNDPSFDPNRLYNGIWSRMERR